MNQQLRQVYEPALRQLTPLYSVYEKLSSPHFVYVPDSYTSTATKLLVVGQETFGWKPTENTVEGIIQNYVCFDLGAGYYRSPFWQAAHILFRTLNPDGPKRSFLWSNLVKIDQNGDRPCKEVEETIGILGLLPAEIAITRPDVVVFFTGPYYDERLASTFPDLAREKVTPIVDRIQHPGLPFHAYRTYHPNYLRRSRQWRAVHEIANVILA